MEKAEFIRLLKDAQRLEDWSYESLEQLILEYPYCLGLRLLLLKKYQMDGHPSKARYLELAMIYAPNFQKIYYFLEEGRSDANEKI